MGNRFSALKEAIDGEFNAIRKYKEYARIAKEEKYPNIAKLFTALVVGESIHLANHKRSLIEPFEPETKEFKVGTTMENLKDAIGGETWEYKDMYPRLLKGLKRAKTDDDEVAKLSLRWAMDTEKNHAKYLKEALLCLENGTDYDNDSYWVCEVCGNLEVGGEPDEICPVCKHDPVFFKEVKA